MPEQLINDICNTLAASRSHIEYLKDLGFEDLLEGPPTGESDCQSRLLHPSCLTETLENIRSELDNCQRCGLGATRNKVVFGVGNPNSNLIFVGEAPGKDEDLQGEPFVGEAGQLLDKILCAIGLTREEIYICNVLKCRPPNNRDPRPDEVATCETFLARQVTAISPQVIVALGRFAVHSLLKVNTPISRIRGEWQSYRGIPLMPTYHPAYLLRNPESKRDVWEDMKEVLRRLNSDPENYEA